MYWEKIIKREDGAKVKFKIHLHIDRFTCSGIKNEYWVTVQKREKGKQKWMPAQIKDYTPEELLQAKTEYWETLKPE